MGTGSFLGQVLDEGARGGRVRLRQGMLSAKDYVSISDVVAALAAIAECGRARLYNVASGVNVTHDAIAGALGHARGWSIDVDGEAASVRYPRIDVNRLAVEFGAPRRRLLDELGELALAQPREAAC
jgi:nucleoside-diphosphate-sugar epimerase